MVDVEAMLRLGFLPKFKVFNGFLKVCLYKDNKRITPYVKEICYDEISGFIYLSDAFFLDTLQMCDLHFFIDKEGQPIGDAWSRLLGTFISLGRAMERYDFQIQGDYECFLIDVKETMKKRLKEKEIMILQMARKKIEDGKNLDEGKLPVKKM